MRFGEDCSRIAGTDRHSHRHNTADLLAGWILASNAHHIQQLTNKFDVAANNINVSLFIWQVWLGLWVRKFPPENFRKFLPISPEILGNLLKNFFTLYCLIITILKLIISMFSTNSPQIFVFWLYALCSEKNNSLLARLLRISMNSNTNYTPCNVQALANIFGNFRKY